MKNEISAYFLGCNSAEGFISEFDKCYDPKDNWTAYIIKGGAGTGKSSIMRKLAQNAVISHERIILCPCSSDPDSLDGVILPDRKTVMIDATAPHTVEPVYPAVCEQIINTGDFWNKEKFEEFKESLIALYSEHSAEHKKASQYIRAAGQLLKYNFSAQLSFTDIEKTFNFAASLCKKYIPKKKSGKSTEWIRFLSGVTPKGYVTLKDTVENTLGRKVLIKDNFGAVASLILSGIRDYCLENNYEIITVKNPILPNDMTDAVIIPELELGFIRQDKESIYKSEIRQIHARRFVNTKAMSKIKQKTSFNKKLASALIDSAVQALVNAKSIHDKIEKYYINAMDFERLNSYAKKIINDILK